MIYIGKSNNISNRIKTHIRLNYKNFKNFFYYFNFQGTPDELTALLLESKEIKFYNNWNHLRFPLQSLPDTNYWLYSLQVNLYGWILEQHYDFKVSGYYLAVVHPEIEKGRLISCPRMDQEMALVVEYEQECGRAKLMHKLILFFSKLLWLKTCNMCSTSCV